MLLRIPFEYELSTKRNPFQNLAVRMLFRSILRLCRYWIKHQIIFSLYYCILNIFASCLRVPLSWVSCGIGLILIPHRGALSLIEYSTRDTDLFSSPAPTLKATLSGFNSDWLLYAISQVLQVISNSGSLGTFDVSVFNAWQNDDSFRFPKTPLSVVWV